LGIIIERKEKTELKANFHSPIHEEKVVGGRVASLHCIPPLTGIIPNSFFPTTVTSLEVELIIHTQR